MVGNSYGLSQWWEIVQSQSVVGRTYCLSKLDWKSWESDFILVCLDLFPL